MLILCGILFTFLLISILFGVELSNGFYDSTERTYETIENDIKQLALIYTLEFYGDEIGVGTLSIPTDNILKYYKVSKRSMETSSSDKCYGYVLVKNNDKDLVSEPFIKCNDYETLGFQDRMVINK